MPTYESHHVIDFTRDMVLSLSKKGWFLRFFATQWRKDNQNIVNLRFLLARLPRRVTASDMTSIWLADGGKLNLASA